MRTVVVQSPVTPGHQSDSVKPTPGSQPIETVPRLNGFYVVSLSIIMVYRVLLGFTGFYWVLLDSIRFYWILLGFTGFYWILLGFTGF